MSDALTTAQEGTTKKLRFQAIDATGKIRRGVLKAESEESARLLLLEDNIFPKTFEVADEEEKITWAPRRRKSQNSAGGEDTKITRSSMATTCVFGIENAPHDGVAGLTNGGRFVFEGRGRDPVLIDQDNVEVVDIRGFPFRLLRIIRLDGSMLEFRVGFIMTHASAKQIARALQKKG